VVCVVAATAPTCVASVVLNDFMLILKHCYLLLLLMLFMLLLLLQFSVHLLSLLLLLAHMFLFWAGATAAGGDEYTSEVFFG
jgi:hypothetical protein